MRDLEDNKPIFKRRHFGTPETFTVIVANYIVVTLGLMIFTNSQHHINWFFWVVLGLLAVYNAYSIYRYREEYNRVAIIAYVISLAGLGLLFLMF
jgi:4-hydroxybenzoate polyprenyltransferase